jgi:hypothetical protein
MVDGRTQQGLAAFAPLKFEIRLPGPIDVHSSLELFRRSGDDLIDRWDGETLVRTVRTEKGAIAYACVPTGTVEQPTLRVQVEDPSYREEAERAGRPTFGPPPSSQSFCGAIRRSPGWTDSTRASGNRGNSTF